MIWTLELDLYSVKMNQRGQICRSKVISFKSYCPGHTDTGPTALLGPLRTCYTKTMKNCLNNLTNRQNNLTTGRIAAAYGRFSGIRQVAPVCTPTQYMLPWALPSPNTKRHLDRLSHFCTAHGRELLYFTTDRGCAFCSLKLPLPMEGSDPI